MIPPGRFRLGLATIVVVTHFSRLELGAAAVYLFFVLSGFWVYRMYAGKYRRAPHPGRLFVASRAWRLLPAFLLFNALAFLFHVALHDAASRQSWLDVIPNVAIIGYASLPSAPLNPAWSLDMELQFYLAFPLLFLLLDALAKRAVLVLAVTLGLGGLYIAAFIDSDNGPATMLPYAGLFLLGVLAARLGWRPSRRLEIGSLTVLGFGALGVIGAPPLRGFVIHGLSADAFAWNPAVNFALALAAGPLALASVHARSTPRDRLVGDMSYIVYCSHWLAVIAAQAFLSGAGRLDKGLAVAGLVALTYLSSYFVLTGFDRPIGRWREAWVARRLRP